MEYYAVVKSGEYISHHGIKGMRWGVRRYQNPDGSLTEAGKKRYYTTPLGDTKYKSLGKQGHAFNKKATARADSYTNSVYSNVKKVNPDYQRTFEAYKKASEANNAHYLSEREKWFRGEGRYKGKSYYQFKDISADDWFKTKDSRTEREMRATLEKMVREAAKGHPLYNRTFKRLKDINVDLSNPVVLEQINYGEYAVRNIMSMIDSEARRDHKHK